MRTPPTVSARRRSVSSTRRLFVLAGIALSLGCSGAAEDSPASDEAAVEASSPAAIEKALSTLHEQTTRGKLAKYYADGARIEACWRNPKGSKLTDMQKALYCSMPLEFRLCNTVVLLTTEETDIAARKEGYARCQPMVDAMFGGRGEFIYDARINAAYTAVFLEKSSGLTREEERALVARYKPPSTERTFPELLAAVVSGLASEAVDVASDALASMIEEAKSSNDPPY